MFALRRLAVRPTSSLSLRRLTSTTTTATTTTENARPPPPLPPAQQRQKPLTTRQLTTPRSKAQARADPHPRLSKTQLKTLRWKVNARKRRLRNKYGPLVRPRPKISLQEKRRWNRPLKPGVLPPYDEALKLLRTDSIKLKTQRLQVLKEIKQLEEGQEKEKLREKAMILEIQSEINLPNVRWAVNNAMVDMKKASHRHLFEQRWRSEGKLDMLMERIHQMKVIPDVLPILHPSFDLHVTHRLPHRELRKSRTSNAVYEPGVYLTPDQTLVPPTLYANVFHTDIRLYTMLLVDPDVPDEENRTFTTFLHWLRPNIPLSSSLRTKIPNLNDHTPYIPPHPQQGTPYHRYTLLLLPQPPALGTYYPRTPLSPATKSQRVSVKRLTSLEERTNFDVRKFIKEHGLNPAKGGGAYMWREKWDETVSGIYKDILGIPEPKYGLQPKYDPYAELKTRKRYV